MRCEICNSYESESYQSLSLHIVNKHKITTKEYYDLYIKQTESKCECGNDCNFKSLRYGYFKYCSSKCSSSNNNTIEMRKQTKLERYGDANYVNVEKSKQTWKSKSESDMCDIIEKRIETNKERYGISKFTNRELSKQTKLERYGDINYTNRELNKDTVNERYGCDNVFQNDTIKQKIKETNNDRYGVDHFMKSDVAKDIIESNKLKSIEFNFKKTEEQLGEYFEIINYENYNNITIKCKVCGDISTRQYQFLHWRLDRNINPCSNCCDLSNKSNDEVEIYDYVTENYSGSVIANSRQIIQPYELDIFIPELKLAFEFNGLYWHSEKYLNNDYHLNKTKLCEENGIHLVHIYEDDWMFKKDIVKSRILNLLGKSKVIYGRKCEIKEVSSKESKEFLKGNHLMGYCTDKIRYGLYYQDELVSLMTFGGLRKNLGSKSKEGSFELIRFSNKLNHTVVGGANRLFAHFKKIYNPINIISYADRSWTMNNNKSIYDTLGFKLESETLPNYFYIIDNVRKNRFMFRKSELIKEGYDGSKTEREIMNDRNIFRIYNSGTMKYIWGAL